MYYLMMFLLMSSFAQCMDLLTVPVIATVPVITDDESMKALFKSEELVPVIKNMIDTSGPNKIILNGYYAMYGDFTIGDIAVIEQRTDILKMILETGNVNQDIKNMMLSRSAILHQDLKAMKLLLKSGANPNGKELPLMHLLWVYNIVYDYPGFESTAEQYFKAIELLAKFKGIGLDLKSSPSSAHSARYYVQNSPDERIREIFESL